jgi:signal transduction histidine kinase/ligand-binding sensor domain-containing protein/DNA-binding response OmpR family regulator
MLSVRTAQNLIKRALHWLMVLGLTCFTAYGQIKTEVTHYSTKDGLSHDGVISITRDNDGFMWFGTYDGLNRFDGHNFVTYKSRPGDSSKLRSNKIRDVIEDNAGFLWVLTFDYKVYRFDKATEQFTPISDGPYHTLFTEKTVVKVIIPDQKKGVWLLTKDNGLYHVSSDNSHTPVVTHYSSQASGALRIKGNVVKFHRTDASGRIWLGTDKGLDMLECRSTAHYEVKHFDPPLKKLFSSGAFSVATVGHNKIYFGTSDGRVILYDDVKKDLQVNVIAPGVAINDICLAKSGILYISTAGKGLFRMMPGIYVKAIPTGADAVYNSLYEDNRGNIWIEPETTGVVKYDPHHNNFKTFIQQTDYRGAARDYKLLTDINGTLWVSMKGGGFGYYNPTTDAIDYFFDQPGSDVQQFSNVVNCLYVDKTGVLWLSGKDGGINKVVSLTDRFTYRRPVLQPRSRSENDVRAMMKDRHGRLWVCTKDGRVHVYDHDREVNVLGQVAGSIGFVYCITEDSKGRVWLGTKGNGLFKATPLSAGGTPSYQLTHYLNNPDNPYSISGDMLYAILEDKKGRIWIGAFGTGLNLLTTINGKDAFFNCSNSFHSYPFELAKGIRDLCEDDKGRIWIASSYGLVVFNPEQPKNKDYQFAIFQKKPGDAGSLGNNSIQCIVKDKKGKLWLGTFGGGVSSVINQGSDLNKVRFRSFTTANGLPNDVVLAMTVDHHNNIWLATAGGLGKIDAEKQTIHSYDPFDGIAKTGFSEAACFTDTTGMLYFGCLNGYISFKPQNIVHKRVHANMALTNLQLYYKNILPAPNGSPLKRTLDETSEITLNHDQNVISIDYTVLDHRDINQIAYSYKLDGFDKSWHQVNDLRKAVYTNIPPGSYTFYVKGVNADILSNIPARSLHIIVRPPFYQTWWAYCIYILLAVLAALLARNIIITMIKLRNKVIVEQKLTEVKLAFFTNISHELRTPLTLIASPLEELAHTEKLSEKGQEYFKIVNRNVNRMIRFTNQLLDFRKIQSGKMPVEILETELVALSHEVAGFFTAMAEEKNINLQVQSSREKIFAWVDAEKIEIVLYNLLSNAFKFSPQGSTIVISVTDLPEQGTIQIKVADEGPGVTPEHLEDIFEIYHEEHHSKDPHLKGTGIGLALARGMAQSHKGKLWAELNETGGLTFILQLQAGHEHFSKEELNFTEQIADAISPIGHSATLQAPASLAVSETDVHPAVILIAEDNPDLRSFLENKLSNFYQVLTAADGAECLKIAQTASPDLIISDIVMPNMDGIQLLDAVKHDPAISHIPVILLTAKSSVESRIRGLRYGADVYLTKPFQNELLMASVDNLLTSRRRLFERFAVGVKQAEPDRADEPALPVTTSKDQEFLTEVIRIVEEKLGDQSFNIDEVASAMSMGRTTFYKKLKGLSSLSPVEFVRELRLKRSKQLLDTGEHTVSEAGYMAGFNSLAYFSTCFKEKYHTSPSAYLKNNRPENA